MSINASHANDALLIHSGEFILLHNHNACIYFPENEIPVFKGHKYGHIYLTSHRVIFKTKRQTDMLLSFSAPFVGLKNVEFIPDNYIKANLRAQPYGNFNGEVNFMLHFKSGGAMEFMNTLRCAAAIAIEKWTRRLKHSDPLPAHMQCRAFYEVPEEVYQAPKAIQKWLPVCPEFTSLRPNSVYMTDHPPAYPGIGKMRECPKCDPFREPTDPVKFPTPTHSFDGCGQPPIYGIFTSSHPDYIFPHQAAYPPCQFEREPDQVSEVPVKDEETECLEPAEEDPS